MTPKEPTKEEIKKENEALQTEVTRLKREIEEADVASLEEKLEKLTENVTAVNEALIAAESRATEAENELKSLRVSVEVDEDELSQKIFVYRRREPGNVVIKATVPTKVQMPDGTFKEMPMPGTHPIVCPFMKSEGGPAGEYRAVYVLDQNTAHGQRSTVAEIKKIIESSYEFKNKDIVLVAATESREEAMLAAGRIVAKAEPELVAGAAASGDVQ
jgi:hypothetical protein